MKRRKLSSTSVSLLLEVFSIVLGISLAFFVNEWRETNIQNEKAQAALQSIQHELQNNLDALTDMLPKHEAFRDSLRITPEQPEPLLRRIMTLGGLSSARITSASWEAAVASDVTASFDYELLRVMALIQDYHGANRQFVNKFRDIIYSPGALARTRNGANSQRVILSIILADWIVTEHALMNHYQQALTLLDDTLN